ncbi:MAG: hypothetical protein K0S06_2948 [Microvirga sp.]|jgi:hypothetical protein|nr:hypothetical protein [Microvirga sp.]
MSSETRELGDPRIVGAMDAGVERSARRPGTAIARGEPTPLRWIDRPEARSSCPLIEKRHAPVLGGKEGIGADRLLDCGSGIAAVEARMGDPAGRRRTRQAAPRCDLFDIPKRRLGRDGARPHRQLRTRCPGGSRGLGGGFCLFAALRRGFRLGLSDGASGFRRRGFWESGASRRSRGGLRRGPSDVRAVRHWRALRIGRRRIDPLRGALRERRRGGSQEERWNGNHQGVARQ